MFQKIGHARSLAVKLFRAAKQDERGGSTAVDRVNVDGIARDCLIALTRSVGLFLLWMIIVRLRRLPIVQKEAIDARIMSLLACKHECCESLFCLIFTFGMGLCASNRSRHAWWPFRLASMTAVMPSSCWISASGVRLCDSNHSRHAVCPNSHAVISAVNPSNRLTLRFGGG